MESGVLAVVEGPGSWKFRQGDRTSNSQDFRQGPGLPTHKVANPFTWLHIETHNHTRKVEE